MQRLVKRAIGFRDNHIAPSGVLPPSCLFVAQRTAAQGNRKLVQPTAARPQLLRFRSLFSTRTTDRGLSAHSQGRADSTINGTKRMRRERASSGWAMVLRGEGVVKWGEMHMRVASWAIWWTMQQIS